MAAPRAMQNAVLGAVIVVELIVLVGHPLFGWGPTPHRFAATPATLSVRPAGPPSARSVLLGLSSAALRTADRTPTAHGRYAYVSRETWQLSDQQVSGPRPRRPLARIVQTWRSARGSGRSVTVEQTRTGIRTVTATLTAAAPLPSLAGGAATLDHRLGLGRGASTQTALQTFASVAGQEPIPPAVEAEILSRLAGDAGLANAGTTRDRAGQVGVAIDYTAPALGSDVRDTLVLDPATGGLLEFDETLAGPPHGLDVATGALLAYTLYLRSGRVDALGARPR